MRREVQNKKNSQRSRVDSEGELKMIGPELLSYCKWHSQIVAVIPVSTFYFTTGRTFL